MNIDNIEVIKDNDISRPENNFYSIIVNGIIVLECVGSKEIGSAISSLMRNPKLFKEMFM
jgi:hypothetical protein